MNEAYLDESMRRDRYIICTSLVPQGSLAVARKRVKSLIPHGKRRIHFNEERDRHRRSVLKEISEMDVSSVIYLVRSDDFRASRTAILEKAVSQLKEARVVRLVMESRSNQDIQDRRDIVRSLRSSPMPSFTYEHQSAHGEPLLCIPDAIAWSWGRGGEWRRRVDDLGLVARLEEVVIS